jgi:hypothetical protein
MASLLNFMKIYRLVQKLLGDRQTGDLISPILIFLNESRLKIGRKFKERRDEN